MWVYFATHAGQRTRSGKSGVISSDVGPDNFNSELFFHSEPSYNVYGVKFFKVIVVKPTWSRGIYDCVLVSLRVLKRCGCVRAKTSEIKFYNARGQDLSVWSRNKVTSSEDSMHLNQTSKFRGTTRECNNKPIKKAKENKEKQTNPLQFAFMNYLKKNKRSKSPGHMLIFYTLRRFFLTALTD